ncbi:MAG: MFS transporter [Actinobacteria bacterium]|nr:MFS transporter [Actinomycetota bacterium]
MTTNDESVASAASGTNSSGRAPTALWLLFIVTALMSIGYGLIFTLLADIRDHFGFTSGGVGLIVFAGFASGFISQLFLSRYADRGRTVLMVRTGIAVAAFSMLWMVFATDLWQWIGGRLLFGLGSGMVSPSMRRVVIARDPQQVGMNLGRQTAFEMGGFLLGPLIAAVLAQTIDLRAPFLFLFITYTAVLALIGRIDLRSGPQDVHHRSLRNLIVQPAMQSALAAAIAFFLTVGMFEAIWAIVLRDLDAPTWLIGVTLSLFSLPMIFFASRAGAIAQRRGPIRMVTISITVAAICTFSYGIGPLWVLIAVSAIHAIADSFTMPANQVAVALSSPPEQFAAGQGLLGATGLAVAGLAALGGSAIYGSHGRSAVFTATAVLMMVFVVIARARWSTYERRCAITAAE